jgi:hypothetical protein
MHTLLRSARRAFIAAALAGTYGAQAAIAPGTAQSGANAVYSGNGELFFAAFDATARVSFALDLGETLNDFFVWGQQDGGNQRFWTIDNEDWLRFLSLVNTGELRWSVLGLDVTGGTAAGGVRLFTTMQQGDEAKIETFSNQLFSTALGSSQAGTFFNAINATGSHGTAGVGSTNFAGNGSSVNADPDPGNSYFGSNSVGLSSTLNGNAPFDISNPVGKSSWFYYLTRSGTNQTATVLVDEFDNLAHDGYWGFTFVDASAHPDSPYAGKHLLSFTLASAQATLAQREFAAGIGRTEWSGGFVVSRLGGAAAQAFESPAGFNQRLGGLGTVGTASAVPEPATWALLTAGLGLLLWRSRRRAAPTSR